MENISIASVKERIKQGESLHLLDVREQNEHTEFNIGGRLLPLGNIRNFETASLDDWKDEEIIVYCRSGNRSMQACMFLEQQGFHVKNLAGGVMEWNKIQ